MLNSVDQTEGNITNVFQVDINRLSPLIYILMQMIIGAVSCVIGFVYMGLLSGWELTSILVAGFGLLSSSYLIIYHYRAKFIGLTLQRKDRRMQFLKNIVDNIEAIKLRALENFYCLKIFEKREDEIKMLRKTALVNSVISGFNELVPASSTLFMLLYYTFLRPETIIKYQQFV